MIILYYYYYYNLILLQIIFYHTLKQYFLINLYSFLIFNQNLNLIQE